MKKRLFISYSHKDTERVISIVRKLAIGGYDVWMDVKDIIPGDNYILKIFEGIHTSDIYVIFLSHASLSSNYVNIELSHAAKKNTENPDFRIIPILLDNVEIPNPIKTIDYIDATSMSSDVTGAVSNILNTQSKSISDIKLSAVEFTLSRQSTVEFSASSYFEPKELKNDCDYIQKIMRENVYGILLNFASIDDFDFTSDYPLFANGLYSEEIKTVSGSHWGDNRKCITANVIVFNPEEKKVWNLLRGQNWLLEFDSISFCFEIPMRDDDNYDIVGRRCLAKLQKNYTFLSYNVGDGAKIMYEDDFYLSFAFTNEAIRITLNTTSHRTNLKEKLQTFNVYDFVKELIV